MKLDKEALSRQRFWYLFSTVVGLWLLILLMLMSGCVSSPIKTQEDAFKQTMNKTPGAVVAGQPANRMADEKVSEASKKKFEVWDAASKAQGHIITWPAKLQRLNALPWGTSLTGDNALEDYDLRLGFKDTLYQLQFAQHVSSFRITDKAIASMRSAGVHARVLSKLEPLKDKQFESHDQFATELKKLLGEELDSSRDLILHYAQFINQKIAPAYFQSGSGTKTKDAKGFQESWRAVLKPMVWKATPSREECWILQEDYCVRLALLDALAEAMKSVARFEPYRDKFYRIESQPEAPPTTPPPATGGPAPPAAPGSTLPAPPGSTPPAPPGATSAPPIGGPPPSESAPPKAPTPTEQVFRNADWELHLAVVPGADGKPTYSGEATLKNVNTAEEKLELAGVALTIRQGSRDGLVRLAEGVVERGKSASVKLPLTWADFDPRLPVEIEQVGFPPPAGRPFAARLRLANPNWELDLLLDRDSQNQLRINGESTIKNINAGLRPQDLSRVRIRLEQKDRKPVEFDIKAESLAWDKRAPLKEATPLPNFDPAESGKPIQVEQLLTWDNAPIRRIDQIEIGNALAKAHGHEQPLHPARPGPSTPAASTAQTTTSTQSAAGKQGPTAPGTKPTPGTKPGATPTPMPGTKPPAVPGQKPGMTPLPGGAKPGTVPPPAPPPTEEGKGPNDVNYHRYVSSNTQYVRRLPVALVLVVEPGCVQEILTALANSPLRFHTRQVMMRHAQRFSPDIRGGKGNEDPNLVVLTIFGVASLYDPPPKSSGQ